MAVSLIPDPAAPAAAQPPVPDSFDRLAPYVSQALGLSEEALARACRPARESELSAILSLRRRVNGEMWWDDEAFVRWRYFSARTDHGTAPYWVVSCGDEILGACGLEPVVLVINGESVSAVRSLDIMVRPELEGLGLGAFMNLVLFRYFPIMLVTGSNDRSHQLLSRMFHHAVDLRFWKAVIKSRAVIGRKMNLGPLSSVVASGADAFLALARSRRRIATPRGITVRELTRFDSVVTDLSRRCERAHRLMVRRSAEYLNWRFIANPRCRHRIFGAFAGDRLDGYLVVRFNVARPNPGREAEIVDWLIAPDIQDSDAVLAALVQDGVDTLVRLGAGLVSCAAVDPAIERAMAANGFRSRRGARLPFFVRAADAEVHEQLSHGPDWFLTRGDFDVE